MVKTKSIIVHIGSGKCGSTSLQHALIDNKEILAKHGYQPFTHYDFPHIIDAAISGYKQHNLPFENKYIQQANNLNINTTETARQINKILMEAENIPILSSEYFFEINPSRRDERLNFLKECVKNFDDVTIMLYFRAPDEYIRSLYIQWFTPLFPISFTEFSNQFDYKNKSAFYSFDFKSHIEAIQNIITPKNLHFEFLHNIQKDDHILDNFLKETIGHSIDELVYKKK